MIREEPHFDYFSELVGCQFASWHTDDTPFAHVCIYSHTCDPVEARSSSQYAFMIPWNVTTSEGTVTTHNARIGRDTQAWTKRFEFDTPREGVNLAVALGPDDATLAFNDSFRINFANLKTGQITNRVDGHSWVVLNLVFSHDGKQLASEDSDKLIVWEVAGACQQACLLGEHIVGFSFDDAQLFTIARASLLARDTKTYESTVIAGPCKLAGVSRNGTTLAWVNSNSILHVWDLNSNRELLQHTLRSPPKSLRFADTDELLGCITADGELLILNVLEQRIRRMPNDAGVRIIDFTFSHDARHVAVIQYQDGGNTSRLMVCEVVSGRNLLQVHTTNCHCVTMLPDGNIVVTGHWDGSIKVWPIGT